MRTSVDLPDDLYRAVKVMAAERGTTVRELVLEGLEVVMRTKKAGRQGLSAPELSRAETGSLEVLHETSDDLIGFP
jgi:hypothetical protein